MTLLCLSVPRPRTAITSWTNGSPQYQETTPVNFYTQPATSLCHTCVTTNWHAFADTLYLQMSRAESAEHASCARCHVTSSAVCVLVQDQLFMTAELHTLRTTQSGAASTQRLATLPALATPVCSTATPHAVCVFSSENPEVDASSHVTAIELCEKDVFSVQDMCCWSCLPDSARQYMAAATGSWCCPPSWLHLCSLHG